MIVYSFTLLGQIVCRIEQLTVLSYSKEYEILRKLKHWIWKKSFMELNSDGLTEGDAHGFFCVLGSLWTLGLS